MDKLCFTDNGMNMLSIYVVNIKEKVIEDRITRIISRVWRGEYKKSNY